MNSHNKKQTFKRNQKVRSTNVLYQEWLYASPPKIWGIKKGGKTKKEKTARMPNGSYIIIKFTRHPRRFGA
ncbi:hypothetical protein EAX61_02420 [Dokdonia sinensis]|uniref:Uncharacterized protein n=1 Tax=Dokdonia sinensis TaxID=2479847 RepID=A0A3M0GEV8_9FLAO|nr:hypothetical protein EAX61_02420 [Dokdonia sinensis]